MNNTYIKKLARSIVAILLILGFVGCGNKTNVKTTESTAEETITITDREGKNITIPKNIKSIISVAPSITETIVHLGLADKLVAVDSYSAKVKGAPQDIPVYDIMTPDIESMAILKPDIVLANAMSRSGSGDPFKPLSDLGVTVTYIPVSENIASIQEDIKFLGAVTGTQTQAEQIIDDMNKEMTDIVNKIKTDENKPKVYFEVASAPEIYSFGSNTFLNELIEMLGAKNILDDQNSWVSVSEEEVIKRNPDIIFTNVDYISDPVAEILARNGWQSVAAVKEKRVYVVDKDASSRPNEYITVAFLEMAKAMYPESFE